MPAEPDVHILWLNTGRSCDGGTVSATAGQLGEWRGFAGGSGVSNRISSSVDSLKQRWR